MDACANFVYSEKDSLMAIDTLADRVEHYSSALETLMLNSRGQCKFLIPLAGLQLVANFHPRQLHPAINFSRAFYDASGILMFIIFVLFYLLEGCRGRFMF